MILTESIPVVIYEFFFWSLIIICKAIRNISPTIQTAVFKNMWFNRSCQSFCEHHVIVIIRISLAIGIIICSSRIIRYPPGEPRLSGIV